MFKVGMGHNPRVLESDALVVLWTFDTSHYYILHTKIESQASFAMILMTLTDRCIA